MENMSDFLQDGKDTTKTIMDFIDKERKTVF